MYESTFLSSSFPSVHSCPSAVVCNDPGYVSRNFIFYFLFCLLDAKIFYF